MKNEKGSVNLFHKLPKGEKIHIYQTDTINSVLRKPIRRKNIERSVKQNNETKKKKIYQN